MIKYVIDMEGGDNGYETTIPAVDRFLKEYPEIGFYVCGDEDKLKELKTKFPNNIEVVNATEIVPMTAGALDVLRLRKSSIMLGLEKMLLDGSAIISAGSTGGFLSACTVKLKTIPGIKRAALISPFPTYVKGKKVVILDIGANNENTPDELVQFAIMGRLYSQIVFDIKEPKTFLLSNGAETEKGSPVVKEASKKLIEMKFPGFSGNKEGNSVLDGEADVIVSEGFTGNVFLKSSEGMAKFFGRSIKGIFKRNFLTKIGYLLCKKGVKNLTETMEFKQFGGAMMLGINGVCVKAHGSSSPEAFYYSIKVAHQLVQGKVNEKLKEGIGNGE